MDDPPTALIPAAGAGERLGRGPKAFVEVAGVTLIARAVRTLSRLAGHVVVAVPPGRVSSSAAELAPARVIAGGDTRQETVARLLAAAEGDLVVVHDAARPFLPAEVFRRVVDAARRSGAATAAVAVRDTVVEADTGETVDRSRLQAVQTPQAFRRAVLVEAHRRARTDGVAATDDAGLVRAYGHPVDLVEGSPWLLKITTPDDLAIAEALAHAWRDR